MASGKTQKGSDDFSIDDFLSEIEKAEDIAASRPLPQERLRNKRRLDREAHSQIESEAPIGGGAGVGHKVADGGAKKTPPLTAAEKRRTTKTSNPDTVTGMSTRAPKSKANSVERPTNLPGFEEPPQAGFGHISARQISREAAKNPEVLAKLNEAMADAKKSITQSPHPAPPFGEGAGKAGAARDGGIKESGVTATVQAVANGAAVSV
ncbi:MAG: hypothetical protein KDJ19_14965, partial [Hyphomicrobiaceae bacterium]|nr:hypothetical protein [Hyphomicrobiaceae bacterium]